jgi:hypothetical protein
VRMAQLSRRRNNRTIDAFESARDVTVLLGLPPAGVEVLAPSFQADRKIAVASHATTGRSAADADARLPIGWTRQPVG